MFVERVCWFYRSVGRGAVAVIVKVVVSKT